VPRYITCLSQCTRTCHQRQLVEPGRAHKPVMPQSDSTGVDGHSVHLANGVQGGRPKRAYLHRHLQLAALLGQLLRVQEVVALAEAVSVQLPARLIKPRVAPVCPVAPLHVSADAWAGRPPQASMETARRSGTTGLEMVVVVVVVATMVVHWWWGRGRTSNGRIRQNCNVMMHAWSHVLCHNSLVPGNYSAWLQLRPLYTTHSVRLYACGCCSIAAIDCGALVMPRTKSSQPWSPFWELNNLTKPPHWLSTGQLLGPAFVVSLEGQLLRLPSGDLSRPPCWPSAIRPELLQHFKRNLGHLQHIRDHVSF
jgi:hypothetical protein